MSKVRTYVERPRKVRAIQWTGDNAEEVVEFLLSHGFVDKADAGRLKLLIEICHAPGDWVVVTGVHEFPERFTNVEFQAAFQLAEEEENEG